MRGRRRWCGGSTGVLVGFFPSLSRLRSRFPFPRCTEIAVNLNIISSAKEQRTGNIFRLVFTNKKKKTSVEYTYYRKALLLVYNRLQERYRSPERKGSEAASHVLVVYFLHLLAFSPLLWAARYDQPPISLKESKWMRPPLHWAQLCLFFSCSLYYYLPLYIQFISSTFAQAPYFPPSERKRFITHWHRQQREEGHFYIVNTTTRELNRNKHGIWQETIIERNTSESDSMIPDKTHHRERERKRIVSKWTVSCAVCSKSLL